MNCTSFREGEGKMLESGETRNILEGVVYARVRAHAHAHVVTSDVKQCEEKEQQKRSQKKKDRAAL